MRKTRGEVLYGIAVKKRGMNGQAIKEEMWIEDDIIVSPGLVNGVLVGIVQH